jgi:predicted RNase H-like HicB family nuclease
VPMKGSGWRAHFPDFPGCRAEGSRIEGTIDASYAEVVARLDRAAEIPAPRSYEDVRADDAWATERGIDWSTAVVSFIRIG